MLGRGVETLGGVLGRVTRDCVIGFRLTVPDGRVVGLTVGLETGRDAWLLDGRDAEAREPPPRPCSRAIASVMNRGMQQICTRRIRMRVFMVFGD